MLKIQKHTDSEGLVRRLGNTEFQHSGCSILGFQQAIKQDKCMRCILLEIPQGLCKQSGSGRFADTSFVVRERAPWRSSKTSDVATLTKHCFDEGFHQG